MTLAPCPLLVAIDVDGQPIAEQRLLPIPLLEQFGGVDTTTPTFRVSGTVSGTSVELEVFVDGLGAKVLVDDGSTDGQRATLLTASTLLSLALATIFELDDRGRPETPGTVIARADACPGASAGIEVLLTIDRPDGSLTVVTAAGQTGYLLGTALPGQEEIVLVPVQGDEVWFTLCELALAAEGEISDAVDQMLDEIDIPLDDLNPGPDTGPST